MPQRNARTDDKEPEQKTFKLPSEKEHTFQVVDVLENIDSDPDVVHAKIEVVGGDEEGRTTLNRASLDDKSNSFWATQLFLKAIKEPYKGDDFAIDTDNWIGRRFKATVKHTEVGKKTFANIVEYNFEKSVEQPVAKVKEETKKEKIEEEIEWDNDL